MYTYLMQQLRSQYDRIRTLKHSPRGLVQLLRHRESGQLFVFREFQGDNSVYRRLMSVDCPNLPHIEETATENGRTAVLEEFIPGDTLAQVLEGGLLEPRQAKNILLQLCRALWVFHSLDVVHRDIKPENVILSGNQAVLIDFDAARTYKEQPGTDTQVLGTMGYAPPEQYGLQQTDGRADIYALGVMLNIMLTGKHPTQALARGKLGRIVRKCTMLTLEKRYQTVQKLMEAL